MYAIQSGLEHKTKNSESDLKFTIINMIGIMQIMVFDEYYSSLGFKREKIKKNSSVSFGYGGEYKYDWEILKIGEVIMHLQRSYGKSRFILKFRYKLNESQILSLYLRTDNHNTTDLNETYKLNFSQQLGKINLNGSSTGLRNPTLYELCKQIIMVLRKYKFES